MSIPSSHQKERFSEAYVSAVVAKAGQALDITDRHSDYGVDGFIHLVENINGKYQNIGPMFSFQLKATINCEFKNGQIAYKMEPDAYNKCVKWNGALPIVLIVYDLPKDESRWFQHSEESLTLQRCAYWRFMNVDDLVKSRKVVRIPQKNIFDMDAVNFILSIAEKAPRVNIDFDTIQTHK